MSDTYKVSGMTCGGCAKSVTNAILDAAPEAKVEVDLEGKAVIVDGTQEAIVKTAVEAAGFEFMGRA